MAKLTRAALQFKLTDALNALHDAKAAQEHLQLEANRLMGSLQTVMEMNDARSKLLAEASGRDARNELTISELRGRIEGARREVELYRSAFRREERRAKALVDSVVNAVEAQCAAENKVGEVEARHFYEMSDRDKLALAS